MKKVIDNLDKSVLKALDFFIINKPKAKKINTKDIPFIVGSGNAYNTAQIIFKNKASIFANESNFKQILLDYKKLIRKKISKNAIIISASGEKDSIWEILLAQKFNLKTTLMTCNANSTAAKLADETIVFQKLSEPYTYNVSTYLAMILSQSNENAESIKKRLESLHFPKDFANYKAYTFILPDKLAAIAPMIEIKKSELFGARLSIRAFSQGEARHAKFVVPWEKELIISLGENKYFGNINNRWQLKKTTKPAEAMAICYYIVGKIQESNTPYFRDNIESYCKNGLKAYGKKGSLPVIVE